ncbi:MAG: hypothetical protein P4L65_05335 [Legionella sp.]|nr:hypothetical protein [Legionella sp.]
MKNPYLKFQISIGAILFLSTASAQAGFAMIMMPFLAGMFMVQVGIPLLTIMFLMEPYVSVTTLVAEIKKNQSRNLPNYSNGAAPHLGSAISPLKDPKKAIDKSAELPLANDSVFTDTASLPNTSSNASYSATINQNKNTKNVTTPHKTQMVTVPSDYATNHSSILKNGYTIPHMFSYPISYEPLKSETVWNNWNRRITIALENAVENPNPLSAVMKLHSPRVNAPHQAFRQLLAPAVPLNHANIINAIVGVNAPQSISPMQQVPLIENEAIPNESVPPANIARNVENNEAADERAALNLLALYHSFNSAPASSMMNDDDVDTGNPTLTQTHLDARPSNTNPPGGLQIDSLLDNPSAIDQTTNDNVPNSIEANDEQMASALLKLNHSPIQQSARDQSVDIIQVDHPPGGIKVDLIIENNSTDNEVETVEPNDTIDSNDIFISSILLELHNSFNNSVLPVNEVLPSAENNNNAVVSSEPKLELGASEDSSLNKIDELASAIAVDNGLYEPFRESANSLPPQSIDVEDKHIEFQQNEASQGASKAGAAINSADSHVPIINSLSGDTRLTSSLEHLALSVTGHLEYGLNGMPRSGRPRIITITNNGQFRTENLSISMPLWPAGTVSSTTCGTSLEAGAECIITVTPGNNATSDGNHSCSEGSPPIPGVIKIVADNAPVLLINVVVLDYGCIYQGGLVYALDDRISNTKSVGGKVVSLTDLIPAGRIGVGFSSSHPKIDPDWVLVDGANNDSASQHRLVSAADYCEQSIAGFRDWYLPQICDMGYGSDLCGTADAPKMQNIQSNLVDFHNLNLLNGTYWSATETTDYPFMTAWHHKFANENNSFQLLIDKDVPLNVRCSRSLN